MVVNRKLNADYVSTWEIFGDSTETKPTVANGAEEVAPDMSIFMELDTAEAYYYDKDEDTWKHVG